MLVDYRAADLRGMLAENKPLQHGFEKICLEVEPIEFPNLSFGALLMLPALFLVLL